MTDRRAVERWIAIVRLGGVLFAAIEVGFLSKNFPAGYQTAAVGAHRHLRVRGRSRSIFSPASPARNCCASSASSSLLFDTAAIGAYATIFSYEYGNQTRWATIFAVAEAALRYGLRGGVAIPLLLGGLLCVQRVVAGAGVRAAGVQSGTASRFRPVCSLLTGLIVGWLVSRLDFEARRGVERAAEAERLRDALGRRVDFLEAANRCARALGSSLEIEQAFGAFIREVRGLVPFERTAIVLVEGESARTMASAGRGANEIFPPGTAGPLRGHGARPRARRRSRRSAGSRGCRIPGGPGAARPRPAQRAPRAASDRRPSNRHDLALPRGRPTPSQRRRSSSSRSSAAWSRPPCRTSERMRRSVTPSKSFDACRLFAPTSSRSSRMSCGARWPP